MVKTVIEFTQLNLKTFAEFPCSIDASEVQTIDYGNYGNTHDRHFWPGIHNETTRTGRPVIIIKTITGRMIATDALKFRHVHVTPVP